MCILRCISLCQSRSNAGEHAQVASHAQKYFLREGLPPSKREKKRPSIHDIRCSRNASQEDRHQLRTSLQQLNRESMESNDSRVADGQPPGTIPLRRSHLQAMLRQQERCSG